MIAPNVPMRLFLDTNIQQALVDYGGVVFEREPYELFGRSGAGAEDVEALRVIFTVATRAHWEFVDSEHCMREAAAARDSAYAAYTHEVAAHWSACIAIGPEPFAGTGLEHARPLDDGHCGYLSVKDGRLIRDAVVRECDTFLTIERKLARNAEHLSATLGIEVLRPPDLMAWLQPHLGAL